MYVQQLTFCIYKLKYFEQIIFIIASITTQLRMSLTENITIAKNVYDRTSYIKLSCDFYCYIFSTYIGHTSFEN